MGSDLNKYSNLEFEGTPREDEYTPPPTLVTEHNVIKKVENY
jgi:hypothetical protein